MPHESTSVAGGERRAAAAPGAAALVEEYGSWLARDGRGSASYINAAWAFLGRWPDPGTFAAEPLDVQLSLGASQRPFVTFLMLTGRCRPGYGYLAHRKIGGLLAQATWSALATDVAIFTTAAADLDFGEHRTKRTAERVVLRVLIQTGRSLQELTTTDLEDLAAAFRRRGQARGNASGWENDRGLVGTAHRILFHLGILPAPPADPRGRTGPGARYDGVAEPLRRLFAQYCAQAGATRAPATIKAIASHLSGFGRFLGSCEPPVTALGDLTRHEHIEAWLAALAQARHDDGTAMSLGHRRGQILTVRQFLADIAEWGWPDVPARTLIYSQDIPRLPHPLPRYLPPQDDRRLLTALEHLSRGGPAPQTRLHADALLLIRATGLRIGELLDLELDCVHQIPGHGAWLKVPLGKLATERMVPLDEDTVTIIDQIAARRTPSRPLPHPRTGRATDFLLVHQGRRVSSQALRAELARAAQAAGIETITPHALRHTFATALVNSGVSLQALMQLLGHVSATMSLRYGRLFDATVRAEYERALTQTKTLLAAHAPTDGRDGTLSSRAPLIGIPLPLVQTTTNDGWKDSPAIKSRLTGGFCLRAPAQGPCAYANICEHCPNFRTDSGYLAVLGAQRADTLTLAADAQTRGWDTEAARHRQLADRLDQLIDQTQKAPT